MQLDEIGKKLYRGEFASQDDRDALYQQMTQLALDESVRVWLVTALQSFPVSSEVENLTVDIVSGPRNQFALRGANIPGRSDIKAGNLWVWTERTTWNPDRRLRGCVQLGYLQESDRSADDQSPVHRLAARVPGRFHGRDRRT